MKPAPKRWLDDVGMGLSSERDLLRSGLNVEPPAGEKDAVWAALLGGLPPGGGAAGGAAGGKALAGKGVGGAAKAASAAAKASAVAKASTTAVATGGLVKSVIIGAGSAALLVGAYTAVAPSVDPPPLPATHVATAPPSHRFESPSRALRTMLGHAPPPVETSQIEAPWPPPEEAPNASPEARRASRRASPVASPAPEATTEPIPRALLLKDANEALTEVRATLRAGNTAGALAQAQTMRVRFPADVYPEEREVLTIESLFYSGSREAARTRAQAFLKAFPNALNASRVQSFAR